MNQETKPTKYKTERAEKEVDRYEEKLQKENGYVPKLTVKDARKFSRRSMIRPFKSKHIHHTLSDGETALFMKNESDPRVIAIYEQFPLLDFKATMRIAEQLGVRHPTSYGEIVIITLDQLLHCVDLETGEEYYESHSYKMSSDLDVTKKGKKRVRRIIEKYMIEKEYLAQFGIPHILKTEQDAPKIEAVNKAWAREALMYLKNYEEKLPQITKAILIFHYKAPRTPIKHLLEQASELLEINKPDILFAFQYGVWSDLIPLDHSRKLNMMLPLRLKARGV